MQRFLFDWKNPIGYIFAFIQEYILVMCAAMSGLCTASFGAGTCFMLIAMAKDIKTDIRFINEISETHEHRCELINQFNKIIQFHSEATQLSN